METIKNERNSLYFTPIFIFCNKNKNTPIKKIAALYIITLLRIPAHPDGKTGNIRTPFRQHPDSKPALSGHLVE